MIHTLRLVAFHIATLVFAESVVFSQPIYEAPLSAEAINNLDLPAHQFKPVADEPDDRIRSFQRPPRLHGSGDTVYGEPIEGGAVIVRGEVLEGPYRIGQRGREVFVNDQLVATIPSGVARGRRSWIQSAANEFVATLEHRLYEGYTWLVFDDKTQIFMWEEDAVVFLGAIAQAEDVAARVHAALEHANHLDGEVSYIPTSQWRVALTDFQPSPSLNAMIDEWGDWDPGADVDFENAVGTLDVDTESGNKWMYMLNVSGMLLVVVSVGTLLGNRPSTATRWSRVVSSPKAHTLVAYSIALIVALSIFDLAATLMTQASGGFTELNPIGGSLMQNGYALATFKLAVTGAAVGILWYLRRYAGAQKAAWWGCLVLTLVTIRWVTVHSLFYV